MDFGAIIIGDELLSGKRHDRHFAHTVEALGERGFELKWCRIIGDDAELITATLRDTFARAEAVFCFGGIGATPDDLTRQCAATAAGVPLIRHPEAVAEIEARFGAEAYPHRILMADLAEGSTIIPNPYNRIPGFTLARHHFLPGFPSMAWPMMEWVLNTFYGDVAPTQRSVEAIITVYGTHESQLLDVMRDIVSRYPALRFSSLPTLEGEPHIELALRGDRTQVATAMAELKISISRRGITWKEQQQGSA